MENKNNKPAEDLSIPKEEPKTQMNDEVFTTIQNQNMGEGLLEMEQPKEPEQKTLVNFKVGKDIKTSGKYTEEIMNDILKNPSKYKFKSKKHGEMNLKSAMDKGYNPETDEFDKPKRKSKEELMEGLADSDKEAINKITDPESAQIPEKDAEALGVKDKRFVKKTNPDELFSPEQEQAAENVIPESNQEEENPNDMLSTLLGGGKA